MAVRAQWKQLAAIGREWRVDIPAQPAQHRLVRRRVGLCKLAHRQRAEDAHTAILAQVQHHLSELRQIVRRRKQPRVPGHAAHHSRRRVVHNPAQRHAVLVLRRRNARAPALRRQEPRLTHAQRPEDLLLGEFIERLAAHHAHDLAQQNEIDVAVNEMFARRRARLVGQRHSYAGLVPIPGRFQVEVRAQSREVRHQIAYRDAALAALEFRQVLGHAVAQPHLALLEQLHDRRRRGDHFRQRGRVEDRILAHRLAPRFHCPLAVRFSIQHSPWLPHQHHRARRLACRDRLFDGRIESRSGGERRLRLQARAGQRHDQRRPHHCILTATESSRIARSTSLRVMPPESCVARSTLTRL